MIKKLFIIIIGSVFNLSQHSIGQSLIHLSEYMPVNENRVVDSNGKAYPWLEIQSFEKYIRNLSEFDLLFKEGEKSIQKQLPVKDFLPGQAIVVWLIPQYTSINDGPNNIYLKVENLSGNENVYLIERNTGKKLDSIWFVNRINKDEYIQKSFFNNNKQIILPLENSTPAAINPMVPNWQKLVTNGDFPLADSEPNACLAYKDKIWILGGWRMNPVDSSFYSSTYLLQSVNGFQWDSVHVTLPFSHYSGFVVFKDTIWVYTNNEIFTTTDGLNWHLMGTTPYHFMGNFSRFTTQGDTLYFVDEFVSGFSKNGVDFTWKTHNIPHRKYGGLKSLNGSLYYFGGQNDTTGVFYNDVWKSTDGLNWQLLTVNAPWSPRKWFMAESFQGRIWMLGGFQFSDGTEGSKSNLNDIWVTQDGINWEPYLPVNPWSIRHAAYHVVFQNRIWLMGGFDNFEVKGFHNDIWTFESQSIYLFEGSNSDSPSSWHYLATGSGPTLKSFSGLNHINGYVIGTFNKFLIPDSLKGKGNNIFIGDGIREAFVNFQIQDINSTALFVTSTGNLIFDDVTKIPEFELMENSSVTFKNYLQLSLPERNWWNLSLINSKVIKFPHTQVLKNLEMLDVNLPQQSVPIEVRVRQNIKVSGIPTFRNMLIEGISNDAQEIEGVNLRVDYLRLKKLHNNFIFKGNFRVNGMLRLLR